MTPNNHNALYDTKSFIGEDREGILIGSCIYSTIDQFEPHWKNAIRGLDQRNKNTTVNVLNVVILNFQFENCQHLTKFGCSYIYMFNLMRLSLRFSYQRFGYDRLNDEKLQFYF